MKKPLHKLIPPPARMDLSGESLALVLPEEGASLLRVIIPQGCELDLMWALGEPPQGRWTVWEGQGGLLRFVTDANFSSDQAYRLRVHPDGICIEARAAQGWFHGAITLGQWMSFNGEVSALPCVTIEDRPQIVRRGYMLDVSRDRLPTMGQFKRVLDQLARLKYNHFELYLEHTFAYAGHDAVHGKSDAITPEEMRELVSYAARRSIEMVPNQNTFGHMHRWLVLPEYNHLAEEPAGTLHPFHFKKEPFSLCAAHEGSLELVGDLLGQLLPLFESPYFNGDLDETFDLGREGSARLCEAKGKGPVYIEYLAAVQSIVAKHGKKLVFWADILLEHPEVFSDLPKGCVPVIWGYESDHPLDAQAQTLQSIGAEFWIAPGTSTWQSLTGRHANSLENIRSAARAALAHGAAGLILTDWGDWGHWQPPSLSNAAILHFAAQAWGGPDLPAPDAADLNRVFYAGNEPQLAEAWIRLLESSSALQDGALNGTSPFYAMRYPPHGLHPEGEWKERCVTWSLEGAEAYDSQLHSALNALSDTDHLEARELKFCVRLALWANERAKERGQNRPVAHDAPAELQAIAGDLSELWPARVRPAGLSDSLAKMYFSLDACGRDPGEQAL